MVLKAVQSGINFIDTSPWYGQGVSEERLGIALKNVPRDKYYIATKVSWCLMDCLCQNNEYSWVHMKFDKAPFM